MRAKRFNGEGGMTISREIFLCVRDGNGRRKTISEELKASYNTVASALTRLCESGHVTAHGTRRHRWYRAVPGRNVPPNKSGKSAASLANLKRGRHGAVGQEPRRYATELERCWHA